MPLMLDCLSYYFHLINKARNAECRRSAVTPVLHSFTLAISRSRKFFNTCCFFSLRPTKHFLVSKYKFVSIVLHGARNAWERKRTQFVEQKYLYWDCRFDALLVGVSRVCCRALNVDLFIYLFQCPIVGNMKKTA